MKREIKLASILGYVEMFIAIAVAFIYTPFMLDKMGQSEYGLYSLVVSLVAYLSVLDMGFGNAMVRYVSKSQAQTNKEKENKINSLFLIVYTLIGAVALIIGIALYFNIENVFSQNLTAVEINKAKIIMIILVATVALNFPLSVFTSYVTASEKFIFLKIITILKDISIPIIMIPLLLNGYKSITMALINNGFIIIVQIITLIYCLKKLKMKFNFHIGKEEKSLLKEIAGYSFFIFLNIIVDALYNNTDSIILGSVSGTVAVAVYAVAVKITQINTKFSTNISGLFLPSITKTLEEKNGEEKVSKLFNRISRIQLYIMMLILSAFFIVGKIFINLWAGPEYIDAYYIILLLIAPAIIPLTQNIGISILQAKNRHQFRSIMYIFIAILNVLISIPLAKSFGGIGAAIGTAIGNLLGQIIIMNIYYYKVIHIDIIEYWKNFIRFSLPVIIVSILGFLLNNKINIMSWKIFIIEGIIYFVTYFIYVYIYMNEDEKNFVKKILNKVKPNKKVA